MTREPQAPDTIVSDEPEFGPAMSALTEKQRRFVLAMLADPFSNGAAWAKTAGYSVASNGHRVAACRMLRDPRIERAVFEVACSHLNSAGPALAVQNLLRIARDPKHSITARRWPSRGSSGFDPSRSSAVKFAVMHNATLIRRYGRV